jgi:hypothetical protein
VEDKQLTGGTANAGAVTRIGSQVLRPSTPHTASIHQFLSSLRTAGFDGASEPVGIDPDGRERLVFLEGDVVLAPYPAWAQSDGALVSIAMLMRRLHEAARSFDPAGCTWSREMADPAGGPIVCHNDVCLENVVFRDGTAVGLVDFDFAAPGRPIYDLAQMARLCVPVDDDTNAARLGWGPVDRPRRLRLVADAYNLESTERRELLDVLSDSIACGGEFLLRQVEDGHPSFIRMWNEMGGMNRFNRRRGWWVEQRTQFINALSIPGFSAQER